MTSEALRKTLIAGAAVAALSVGGCATNSIVPPSADVAVLQGVTTLETSYNVAAQAYLARWPVGAPVAAADQALHAQIKAILIKAYAAVNAAESAQVLGDATSTAAQVAAATTLIAQAQSLLTPK